MSNQDGVFQWHPGAEDDGGHIECRSSSGTVLGRVRKIPSLCKWEGIPHVGGAWVTLHKLHWAEEEAMQAMEQFWRDAAAAVKEMGL